MRKLVIFTMLISLFSIGYSQNDTISNNIYQNNGRLGIGTSSPETLLNIRDNAGQSGLNPRQFIKLHNTNNSITSNVAVHVLSGTGSNEAAGSFGVGAYSYAANLSLDGFTYLYSSDKGLALRAVNNSGIIKFNTAGNGDAYERMRIDAIGNVGIGTTNPKAKLQVADGDIYISDINKGIIMKSPNGQCWRGVIDNVGNLNFSAIDCPKDETLSSSMKNTDAVDIYPNPSDDYITVVFNQDGFSKLNYSINSTSGKLIETGKIKANNQKISLKGISSGMYVLNIYDENGVTLSSEKIIKK